MMRALIIASALAAGITTAGAQAAPRGLTPSSWIQLRGGIDNAGVVAGALDVSWRYRATRPVRGVSVADGVVIVGTESADADAAPEDFKPDQRGFLAALDATTGRMLWSRPVPSWVHGDPLVFDQRVFVGYGRWPMTHPGGVLAADLHTGRTLWALQTDAGVMPAPALDTTSRTLLFVGGDGVLYVLGIDDGRVEEMRGLRSADAMSSPRIDESRTVYLGTAETLRSLSAAGGAAHWSYHPQALRAIGDIPPAVAESIVFTTGTRRVGFWKAARSLPTPKFLRFVWEARKTHPLRTYNAWFREQRLVAVDRRRGRLLWERPLGIGLEVPRNTSGTPVAAGNRVLVSSPVSRIVWAFDASSGREIWRHQLAAIHKGAITPIGEDVLLGDKSGTITLLNLSNGRVVGRCAAGGAFTPTAPVLVGKTLFVATKDGWLHAERYADLRARAIEHAGGSCFAPPPETHDRVASATTRAPR
jgi:outer membrane protein assembly factor BamB